MFQAQLLEKNIVQPGILLETRSLITRLTTLLPAPKWILTVFSSNTIKVNGERQLIVHMDVSVKALAFFLEVHGLGFDLDLTLRGCFGKATHHALFLYTLNSSLARRDYYLNLEHVYVLYLNISIYFYILCCTFTVYFVKRGIKVLQFIASALPLMTLLTWLLWTNSQSEDGYLRTGQGNTATGCDNWHFELRAANKWLGLM